MENSSSNILEVPMSRTSYKFQPFQILTFFHDSNAKPIAVQIEIVGKTEHHDSADSIVNFPGYCSSTTYLKKVIRGLVFKLVSNLKTEVEIFFKFCGLPKNCVLLSRECGIHAKRKHKSIMYEFLQARAFL